MHQGGFGVMTHYLADAASAASAPDLSVEQWNRRVDSFDVPGLVAQLREVGAAWLIFTLGQNSGFYCSPNAAYDRLVGHDPSRLSRRDLVGELGAALKAEGIRLIAYLPSHAPAHDRQAIEGLACTPRWDAGKWGYHKRCYAVQADTDERLTNFQRNWEAVVAEWSQRWGGNVGGWWIDGCYYADRMYRRDDDDPGFRSFATALKAGNADSLVAFNPGVLANVVCHTPFEDYTAGECNVLVTAHRHDRWDRWVTGAQRHILTYLAWWWGDGEPRFPDELPPAYTRHVVKQGGVVTWDVPISARGRLSEAFMRQLAAIQPEIGR
jgi:alpha-L-fucosidase